jgi:hypothetical protein
LCLGIRHRAQRLHYIGGFGRDVPDERNGSFLKQFHNS